MNEMSSNSAWTGARPHIDESDLLCKTGCGFYGNPAWEGHCSKCYKDLAQKRQQRKAVFDPTQFKNKVSRSVSDVSEFQSKASSLVSKKLDKFEEKRRQQLDKKTKAVKSIFRKSQTNRVIHESSKDQQHRLTHQPPSKECQAVIAEFNLFFQTINKDAMLTIRKHIKAFMDKILDVIEALSVDDLGDQVHDLYNSLSDMIATNPVFCDFTQDQVERLHNLTERYITTYLHRDLMNAANAFSEEKDLAIQNRIRSLLWINTSHLECRVDEFLPEIRAIMDQIITDLIEIGSRRVPMDKLNLLVSASNRILNLLKQSNGGIPASADDFLPALIYCVLRANPPLLHSNICYITNFAQQSYLQSGEAGYFFTNLCCAVSFIEKLTADSLGLTQAEFDRQMSGDALPIDALDGTYMCEGMRVLQQNLDNLTDLGGQMSCLIDNYDQIMADMEAFKDKLTGEVNRVLEGTPLTIRPKTADIDDPDPTQELLPPPLMPLNLQVEVPQTTPGSVTPIELGLVTPDSELLKSRTSPVSHPTTPAISSSPSGGQLDFKADECSTYFPSYFDPFMSDSAMMMSGSFDDSIIDPTASTEHGDILLEKEVSSHTGGGHLSSFIPKPSMHYMGSHYHHYNSSYQSLNNNLGYVSNTATQPLYTGFTVQGGKIPSIPCDTGMGCTSPSKEVFSPLDPLSPPIAGPQKQLPEPLQPTVSPTMRQPKKEDRLGSLLGDIIGTFDGLI